MIKVIVGTNEKPGPDLEIPDSLETLNKVIREQFALGYSVIVASVPGLRLVFDSVDRDQKTMSLFPRQR